MIGMLLLLSLAQATWEPVRPPVLHQGRWLACGAEERVLEHRVLGQLRWELHLGPLDEFALYDHQVDGAKHTHDGADNLLGPAFRVSDLETWRSARQWSEPRLGVWISVVQAGEAGGCNSYHVRIEARPATIRF